MHVRPRLLLGVIALILASIMVPAVAEAQDQPSASRSAGSDLETSVAETLEANPGSVLAGENTIVFEPGVMAVLPSEGEVGTRAASDCPYGWLCAWPHSDFRGPMLAVRQGTWIPYWYWYWNDNTGQIVNCEIMCGAYAGPGWHSYSEDITSIYNNTYSITWAPFLSPRNGVNYYAYRGAPSGYVGAKWNDSFSQACAC